MATPDERSLEIAAFRYRVIAEAAEAGGEGVAAALRRAAARTYLDPRGRSVRFRIRTLWRWLAAWRRGRLVALARVPRKDRRSTRAIRPEVLERAKTLRRRRPSRPTPTIIDILVREKRVARSEIARSTLDRQLELAGLSRRLLRTLGRKVFRQIATEAPFDLVVCDFHHGPYVRVEPDDDDAFRRALLCAFIDHNSRSIPEGRYYLHEDFAALRFGFRRLLVAYGLPRRLYVDNGPAYQASRFHAACDGLEVDLVHSKPYAAEGRGVVERFNRTVKGQFEDEVHARGVPLTLAELNAFFEAWLAERYHRDIHSEIGEAPLDRFQRLFVPRPAPDLALVDEQLRLRERRTVHRKWSTVEVGTVRYLVDLSLRGRRVDVLFDPFDPSYVLVVFDGRVVERAFPRKPGELPPQEPEPATPLGTEVDYLALLRRDFEQRAQAELAALRLRPAAPSAELSLADLAAEVERCRGAQLSDDERSLTSALWRKLRPIDPEATRAALDGARRRLGPALHVRVYLDALAAHLVRRRTKGEKKP